MIEYRFDNNNNTSNNNSNKTNNIQLKIKKNNCAPRFGTAHYCAVVNILIQYFLILNISL